MERGRGVKRLLKGVGLDKAAQLEMSHISSYILSSVSSGSTLTTCSPNTPVWLKRGFAFWNQLFLCVHLQNYETFAKGVERKCIVMQNNQWCIHNAFKLWIYPVGRVHSTTDSLRIESKDVPKRILLVAVVITIIVINKVTITFHHHPFLLYELEPKNVTLETPPTWEKSLPHKKWQTNRNGVASQRQRATFQIFLHSFSGGDLLLYSSLDSEALATAASAGTASSALHSSAATGGRGESTGGWGVKKKNEVLG